jgi:hypothetical protein
MGKSYSPESYQSNDLVLFTIEDALHSFFAYDFPVMVLLKKMVQHTKRAERCCTYTGYLAHPLKKSRPKNERRETKTVYFVNGCAK